MNKVIEIIVMLVSFLTAQRADWPADIFTTRRDPATTQTELL